MRYIQRFGSASTEQAAIDAGRLGKPYVVYLEDEQRLDWNSKNIDYAGMPLTFEIISGGTINWKTFGEGKTIQYRLNGGEWTDITSTKEGTIITVNDGDKVQFRANNFNNYNGSYFLGTAMYNAYGNIMSLINPTNFQNLFELNGDYTFAHLFGGGTTERYTNTGIIDASNLILPATGLTDHAYHGMFADCLNLVAAPALPAKTLVDFCYQEMFYNCQSLIKAPELLADYLPTYAYYYMFGNCSKLNYVKCLATGFKDFNSVNCWLVNVSKQGTFVKHPNATWPTGYLGIPTSWTVIDADI